MLSAREAVSFVSFRVAAVRARSSVSVAEVGVLRQIVELQRATVDRGKVCFERWGKVGGGGGREEGQIMYMS